MWKRSFIFLVVLVWVVSSLCAYPAFFYGGAKEETPAVAEALPPEEASTEELEKSAQDLISSAEASAEVASDRTEEFDDTKSVIELLEEARVKSSVIEKVKEACFLIDEGRAEMIAAYEEEAEARAKAEKEAEIFRKQLGNPKFVERAPEKLVAETRAKLAAAEDKLANIRQSIQALG